MKDVQDLPQAMIHELEVVNVKTLNKSGTEKEQESSLQKVGNKLGRHPLYRLELKGGEVCFAKKIESQLEVQVLNLLNTDSNSTSRVPKIKWVDGDSTWLVTESVKGTHPNRYELMQSIQNVVEALVDCHQTVALNAEIELINHSENEILLFQQGEQYLDDVFQPIYQSALSKIKSQHITPVLLHGDLVPENILIDDGITRFIDWEFARQGDCRWDLAALIVEFELADDDIDLLLCVYQSVAHINRFDFKTKIKYWTDLYAIISYVWSKQHDQDAERYQVYLQARLT